MAQKFYAPKNALNCLTITTHPGTLTEWDIITNLVRMNLMEDGLSVEEALALLENIDLQTLMETELSTTEWD